MTTRHWREAVSALLEAVSGLLAAALGGAALVYVLKVPMYSRWQSCHTPPTPPVCTTGPATFLQVNGTTGAVSLCIYACLLLGVASTSTWHSWTGQPGARVALWVCAGALTFISVNAVFTIIGVYFLPSVVPALVACLGALGNRQTPAV